MVMRPWHIGCARLAIAFGVFVSFVLGALIGNDRAYKLRYDEEREAVEPILRSNPVFAGVEIQRRSNGGIWLSGEVPTTADRDQLREALTRAIGERRAREAVYGVNVKEMAEKKSKEKADNRAKQVP